MLNRHCFSLLILLFIHFNTSGNDSLINSRNSKYYEYLNIKNNTEKFGLQEYGEITQVLESIVFADNILIDTLNTKIKTSSKVIANLSETHQTINEIEEESERSENKQKIIIGCLFVVIIILFIAIAFVTKKQRILKHNYRKLFNNNEANIKTNKINKEEIVILKEKFNDKGTLISNLKSENDSLLSKLQDSNEKITVLSEENLRTKKNLIESEAKIYSLEKELNNLSKENIHEAIMARDNHIEILQSDLRALEENLETKQKEINKIKYYYSNNNDLKQKIGDSELNLIKLQKLNDMHQQGLISFEEFHSIKQKLLSEF